jgi:hypothetical protein
MGVGHSLKRIQKAWGYLDLLQNIKKIAGYLNSKGKARLNDRLAGNQIYK